MEENHNQIKRDTESRGQKKMTNRRTKEIEERKEEVRGGTKERGRCFQGKPPSDVVFPRTSSKELRLRYIVVLNVSSKPIKEVLSPA